MQRSFLLSYIHFGVKNVSTDRKRQDTEQLSTDRHPPVKYWLWAVKDELRESDCWDCLLTFFLSPPLLQTASILNISIIKNNNLLLTTQKMYESMTRLSSMNSICSSVTQRMIRRFRDLCRFVIQILSEVVVFYSLLLIVSRMLKRNPTPNTTIYHWEGNIYNKHCVRILTGSQRK